MVFVEYCDKVDVIVSEVSLLETVIQSESKPVFDLSGD